MASSKFHIFKLIPHYICPQWYNNSQRAYDETLFYFSRSWQKTGGWGERDRATEPKQAPDGHFPHRPLLRIPQRGLELRWRRLPSAHCGDLQIQPPTGPHAGIPGPAAAVAAAAAAAAVTAVVAAALGCVIRGPPQTDPLSPAAHDTAMRKLFPPGGIAACALSLRTTKNTKSEQNQRASNALTELHSDRIVYNVKRTWISLSSN